MPSFDSIEVTVTSSIDLEFEVFCVGCGEGICGNAHTRESRRRGMPQVIIEPCERCLEMARDEGRYEKEKEYEERISELEAELEEARRHALS